MKSIKLILLKAFSLAAKMAPRPNVGGLQISDSIVQYAFIKKDGILHASARLPQGVIQDGIIKDGQQLLEALQNLHESIAPGKKEKEIRIVISMPSQLIFTQSFKIPYIDDDKIAESAELNLRMITPIEAENAFMSWKKIGENDEELEMLGAFTDRKIINSYREILVSARFSPITFEFPGLALSRLALKVFGKASRTILLLSISTDGISFLIIRNGELYFDYFISWVKVKGENEIITEEVFDLTLIQEVGKVINFVSSRFGERLEKIFFIAPDMEERLAALMKDRFDIPTGPFTVREYSLPPSWYSTLGSAMRSVFETGKEHLISFGSEDSNKIFFKERVFYFSRLWRNALLAVFGFLIFVYGGAAAYLTLQSKRLETQMNNIKDIQAENSSELEGKIREFNNLVLIAKTKMEGREDWGALFDNLKNLSEKYEIRITRFVIGGDGAGILEGRAKKQEEAVKFKNSLAESPKWKRVDLPLTGISVTPEGEAGFSLNFSFELKRELYIPR